MDCFRAFQAMAANVNFDRKPCPSILWVGTTSWIDEKLKVRIVRAHTLTEANASTRVLTKCGFQRINEVIDPDDGLVWRWEKQNCT